MRRDGANGVEPNSNRQTGTGCFVIPTAPKHTTGKGGCHVSSRLIFVDGLNELTKLENKAGGVKYKLFIPRGRIEDQPACLDLVNQQGH